MKRWDYKNKQWSQLPSHLKHLPLFTRHLDLTSFIFRHLWSFFLKGLAYRFYIRLKVHGEFAEVYKKHPKLLVIANHGSHLDATSIAAAIPFRYWSHLYITAAKDYFFANAFVTFFSKHCLGAIPIDRKDKKGEAVKLCLGLLKDLERVWMILFPEGTRSKDGRLNPFRKGVSLFSQSTGTPILFLYVDGNTRLWPKGQLWPSPGRLALHVGPVVEPGPPDILFEKYLKWVKTVNPDVEYNGGPS